MEVPLSCRHCVVVVDGCRLKLCKGFLLNNVPIKNQLRGDMYDTQMQVTTKPFNQGINTDGDINDSEGEGGEER